MFLVISETESDMKIIRKDQQNFLSNFPMNLIIYYLFRNAFFLMRLSIQSQNFQSSGNSIILKISFMISLVYYLLSAVTFPTTLPRPIVTLVASYSHGIALNYSINVKQRTILIMFYLIFSFCSNRCLGISRYG